MVKQITENESRIVEVKCDLIKYCIDKGVDSIGKIGVVVMGLGVGLYIASRIK